MPVILQKSFPPEMSGDTALPGIAPAAPDDWLRVDDAYGAQMAHRIALLRDRRAAVYWMAPQAERAAQEVLDEALCVLPKLGFEVGATEVRCPDGRQVALDRSAPLLTLGHLVQEDICLLQKRGSQHVLDAAVLCFPASWQLAEKAGKPLVAIHEPVHEYTDDLARRVQRLFDGVRAGRPLWRYNRLWYDDPELHQPRSATSPRRIMPDAQAAPYVRSERQCVVRLPVTDAVVFSIHTYVVAT